VQWSPLDAARLSALSPRDSGARWLSVLAEAGVERLRGDGPPHRAMAALYDAAWSLSSHDEAVTETRVTDKLHFSAPPGMWLLVPGLYVGFILLAAFRNDFGARLVAFGALWSMAGLAALGVLLWIAAATWSLRAARRQQHTDAQQARAVAARAVARARDTLLSEPFVLRVRENRFLQHVPDLNRIEKEMRTLAPTDPQFAALQQQRAALTAAVTALRQAPPERWSRDGLRLSDQRPAAPNTSA